MVTRTCRQLMLGEPKDKEALRRMQWTPWRIGDFKQSEEDKVQVQKVPKLPDSLPPPSTPLKRKLPGQTTSGEGHRGGGYFTAKARRIQKFHSEFGPTPGCQPCREGGSRQHSAECKRRQRDWEQKTGVQHDDLEIDSEPEEPEPASSSTQKPTRRIIGKQSPEDVEVNRQGQKRERDPEDQELP